MFTENRRTAWCGKTTPTLIVQKRPLSSSILWKSKFVLSFHLQVRIISYIVFKVKQKSFDLLYSRGVIFSYRVVIHNFVNSVVKISFKYTFTFKLLIKSAITFHPDFYNIFLNFISSFLYFSTTFFALWLLREFVIFPLHLV